MENTLLVRFSRYIISIPAGPCRSPPCKYPMGDSSFQVDPYWFARFCGVWAESVTRESEISCFFTEAGEKHWIKPPKSRGDHVPAEEVTSSATLLPGDHPAIVFCLWK